MQGMTPLGKPLVFYLKYMAEMNRLYCDLEEGEERDLAGLDNPEQILEMARTVGNAASEQVADFLELCAKGITDYFTSLRTATIAKKTKRSTAVNYWYCQATVQVQPGRDTWFNCGVSVTGPPEVRIPLEKDAYGIVVPWLWARGGREREDAVWRIVGDWAHSRGAEGAGGESGMVALACIPVRAHPPESLDVDRDPLIAEVMKAIARLGSKETKAISSLAARTQKTR
jgi:hypothetical protein